MNIDLKWNTSSCQLLKSLGYFVIKESDIAGSILGFVTENSGIEDLRNAEINSAWISMKRKQKGLKHFCPIDINYTDNEASVSLHPSDSLVRKSFSKVNSGGRWTPTNCKPRIKGIQTHILIGLILKIF